VRWLARALLAVGAAAAFAGVDTSIPTALMVLALLLLAIDRTDRGRLPAASREVVLATLLVAAALFVAAGLVGRHRDGGGALGLALLGVAALSFGWSGRGQRE
jgi:hypothetical protein